MKKTANKAFKSDSQRLAVSLRSSIAKRCSHLNAALVASSEHCVLLSIVIDSAARGESLTFCC